MSEKTPAEALRGRPHDVAPSNAFAEFMATGWAPTPLTGIIPAPAVTWCVARREALSQAFPGVRLVIPAGNFKVRSNDCDYRFRPHSAFANVDLDDGTRVRVPHRALIILQGGLK